MQCPKCRRELEPGEAVYQHLGLARVCLGCMKRGEALLTPKPRRSPKPCANCGRPVINLSRRREPEIIACSPRCRYTVRNARYRARHARARQAVTCVVCAEPFTPKRRDALYCSAGCKQRAFRRRLQEEGGR